MDKKIQELTQKIYAEGVEKANKEAEAILAAAQAKAAAIEAAAQKEADRIHADAQKEASDLKQNTQAEIKMYAAQALDALKSEVATLISNELAAVNTHLPMADKEFMQQIILALVTEWGKKEAVVIETEDADTLMMFFKAKAKELLDKGLKIKQVNGLKTDFAVSPADGSYKVTFGEAEFTNYFKAFLRPQLVEMLFSSKA